MNLERNSTSDDISIATTYTSVALDFISILEAEVDEALDPPDSLVLAAQAVTEDPAFEGKCHFMNRRKLELRETTRFQSITASLAASLHQANAREKWAYTLIPNCATLGQVFPPNGRR
ncbi:hypothetical protein FCOIX_3136 [Fusarium coicis]|nr:hypothetical protein FCOIX_3136 [Fusarium coicis]